MKKYIFLFLIALMAASCSTVVFDSPYPIGATSIEKTPKALIGEYINPFKGDTVKIEKGNISDWVLPLSNGNEVVLKKWNDFYVINVLDESGYYKVYLIAPIKGKHLKLIQFGGKYDGPYETEKLYSQSELALSLGINNHTELCSCLCDTNNMNVVDCYPSISEEDLEQIKFECEDGHKLYPRKGHKYFWRTPKPKRRRFVTQ
jgi:hypothetical protein